MYILEGLELSPIARMMVDTLDPVNNQTGWQTMYDMVSNNQEVMQQVMFIDPKVDPPTQSEECDELYVPPLPKAAQLDEKLVKSAEG